MRRTAILYSLLFERMSACSSLTKKVFFFFFCPGGLDTLIRDLTHEDREFIVSQLDNKDPDGKLSVY